MNGTSTPSAHHPLRKMLVSAILGGIAGFFAVTLLLRWTEASLVGDSSLILSGVGAAYLAMALIVGIGALVPGPGAKVLNVEDREELIEQRPQLLSGSFANGILGAMMIVLANSGEGGSVPVEIAVASVAIAIVVTVVTTMRSWKLYDELMRQLSHEAASIGGLLVMAAVLIWGAFSMNGIGPAFDAKSIIALVMGTTLLASFIAAGKRGMLNPR